MYKDGWYGDRTDDERIALADQILNVLETADVDLKKETLSFHPFYSITIFSLIGKPRFFSSCPKFSPGNKKIRQKPAVSPIFDG